ncbi:MAG TPA: ATP-binding protein [Solirubrobacterales bacterium]|nr:ATP-binding protein [Solirubrobacterales bacterium]
MGPFAAPREPDGGRRKGNATGPLGGAEAAPGTSSPRTGDGESLRLLTAETAHDFNNLLSVILSCASELEDGRGDPGTRERAEEIRTAAERATGLTRRLIDATRPTGDAIAPLDLSRAITACSRLLTRALGPDVELAIEPAAGLPRVRISEEQVEQILLNLAGNARDAMPSGGSFTIRARMVAVESGDERLGPGWYVCLQATDTGIGMSADQLERAIEPYFTTKHGARGSGLGLPTIAGAARAAGGDLRLRSEPGAGTAAAIYLPAVRRTGEPLTMAPSAGLDDGDQSA